MDSILEDKIIELLTASTIDNVDDNMVVCIDTELQDWDEISDYPVVIVVCDGWFPTGYQAGAVIQEYTIFIALIVTKRTVKECKEQRTIIHNRIASTIRRNQQLMGLTDETGKEHAFQMNITEVSFAHAGFEGYVQAVAHFRISIQTNLVGPF